jgi:glucose-1-phosphate thymidylyltransferase
MSPVTTAVVLARGLGTRMQRAQAVDASAAQVAAASSGAKALMPIGRHVLVDYIVSALADAGIRRVVMVVPPEHEAFGAHFRSRTLTRVEVAFAVQAEPKGTANAVAAAADAVGGQPFLAINGDNYYPVPAVRDLCAAGPHAIGAFDPHSLVDGGNIPADRLPRFAFVWADEHGHMARFEEKPAQSPVDDPHALVNMNLWVFGPRIFEACARVAPSVRGELELGDAVRLLAGSLGEPVSVVPVRGPVLDLSSRADISSVERLLQAREVRL